MTISYDFVAFSGRLSENSWTLGMKAIQGEVPLDIVIPNLQTSSDSDDKDIIGVLTKEGISRESSDVMELYRYLRQLNPKSNQAFGYNEVVIRNIHTRLNSLKVDEELRVQITYTERKENYIASTYSIKLLGIFQITAANPPILVPDATENIEIDASEERAQDIFKQDENPIIPKDFPRTDPDIPIYRTTNTLEKLIAFTRTLQSELKETQQNLALMTEKLTLLEEERQHYREQENLLQEILERLNHLESFDKRINFLEDSRHQLDKFQQTLVTFFRTSNRQTRTLLNEVNDETDNTNSDT